MSGAGGYMRFPMAISRFHHWRDMRRSGRPNARELRLKLLVSLPPGLYGSWPRLGALSLVRAVQSTLQFRLAVLARSIRERSIAQRLPPLPGAPAAKAHQPGTIGTYSSTPLFACVDLALLDLMGTAFNALPSFSFRTCFRLYRADLNGLRLFVECARHLYPMGCILRGRLLVAE